MHELLRFLAAAISVAALSTAAVADTPQQRLDTFQAGADPGVYPGTMTLDVVATDLDHKVFAVQETLPVTAGPLRLYYPRWLPGDHAPTGRVSHLAGLRITAGGKPLDWKRDALDTHAFQLEVPPGVEALNIEFQTVTPTRSASDERVVVTPDMLGLQWNTVLLYPAGPAAAQISVKPRLTLPAGWRFGSALTPAAQQGATIDFQPVSLETLVDSPVFAGRHFQQIDLDPAARAAGRPPVYLNVVADQARDGVIAPEQLAQHRALVTQADRLFGPRRFARYDFLVALSEEFGELGLEHQQSSENGFQANYFTDWAKHGTPRQVIAHEYAHSWNGKFRRPADLWTPDFHTPMQNSLLWMYEGQTEYWGVVLAARAGLMGAAEARDDLASTAAYLSARSGRVWRNLQDTTHEPILSIQGGSRDWHNWQRGPDYYGESVLIWLEADMLIRERSGGKRSLDDFARAFFGADARRPGHDFRTLLYTFDDVVRALDRVQPFDWAGFLRQRLDTHEAAAPLGGITQSGWTLAWSEQPSDYFKTLEAESEFTDFSYSLGLRVGKEDKLTRVLWASPAFQAGLAPGASLLAVNGRAYKGDDLKSAITQAKVTEGKTGGTIELLVKTGDRYRSVPITWNGGLRYPRLERVAGTPDRLSVLFSPLK